jgi:hypothetical protein
VALQWRAGPSACTGKAIIRVWSAGADYYGGSPKIKPERAEARENRRN